MLDEHCVVGWKWSRSFGWVVVMRSECVRNIANMSVLMKRECARGGNEESIVMGK